MCGICKNLHLWQLNDFHCGKYFAFLLTFFSRKRTKHILHPVQLKKVLAQYIAVPFHV